MEVCAFSVSSSGERCVLEKSMSRDGNVMYECQVSLDHFQIILHADNGIFYAFYMT